MVLEEDGFDKPASICDKIDKAFARGNVFTARRLSADRMDVRSQVGRAEPRGDDKIALAAWVAKILADRVSSGLGFGNTL